MAAAVDVSQFAQKRPLSVAENEDRPVKRPRQTYTRQHRKHYGLQARPDGEPTLLEEESLEKLLVDAIKAICEEVGAQNGEGEFSIDSIALEAFVGVTEEFILKFCAMVRRSMIASRRIMPIAPDFESAINALALPWPSDQLKEYLTKPVINPPLLPTPPPDQDKLDVFQPSNPFLDAAPVRQSLNYIPKQLPPLPSAHTYKDTPVYSVREADTRRIRELATEEGKLGEEALRKLANAVKTDTSMLHGGTTGAVEAISRNQKRRKAPQESTESMFEATVRELANEAASENQGKVELGPIVNCEKKFLMQDSAPPRRRPPDQSQGVPASHLSDRARGKQRVIEVYVDTPLGTAESTEL